MCGSAWSSLGCHSSRVRPFSAESQPPDQFQLQQVLYAKDRLHEDLQHCKDELQRCMDENASLKAKVAELQREHHRMHEHMRSVYQEAKQQEARVQAQLPANDGTARGICIRWHEEGHRNALTQIFDEAGKASGLPGGAVYEWDPGAKYALVMLVLYPATPRLSDSSVFAALRECQAAAATVALVALRWGVDAPELKISQASGAAVINLYWDKDATEQKFLLSGAKNDSSLRQLRELITSAVPVRKNGLAAKIGSIFGWP